MIILKYVFQCMNDFLPEMNCHKYLLKNQINK